MMGVTSGLSIGDPAWDSLAVSSAMFQVVQLQYNRILLAWVSEDYVDGGPTEQQKTSSMKESFGARN